MNKDENKELQRRDAMPFPFRWFTSLIELSDADLRQMLFAIGEYAKSGEVPNFTGALKALWREYSERIDFDQRKYEETCRHRRENIQKRWKTARIQKNTNVCSCIKTDTKYTDADLKETLSCKETAEPFSLSGTQECDSSSEDQEEAKLDLCQ